MAAFQNGLETDYWYYFLRKGNKQKEGHFNLGKKQDWWLFYDKMERVNHKCQLKNNQKNGYCLMYQNEELSFGYKIFRRKKNKRMDRFSIL